MRDGRSSTDYSVEGSRVDFVGSQYERELELRMDDTGKKDSTKSSEMLRIETIGRKS